MNQSQTIPIKLKRRLSYKHHYKFPIVRPVRILEEARYLVQTSDIFKSEGIHILDSYVPHQGTDNEEWSEFINKDVTETSDNLLENAKQNM